MNALAVLLALLSAVATAVGPPQPFGVVFLPDSQDTVSEAGGIRFERSLRWTCACKKQLRMAAVVGLGDMTQDNTDEEWHRVATGLACVQASNISVALARGNHDTPLGVGESYDGYHARSSPSSWANRDTSWFTASATPSVSIRTSLWRHPKAALDVGLMDWRYDGSARHAEFEWLAGAPRQHWNETTDDRLRLLIRHTNTLNGGTALPTDVTDVLAGWRTSAQAAHAVIGGHSFASRAEVLPTGQTGANGTASPPILALVANYQAWENGAGGAVVLLTAYPSPPAYYTAGEPWWWLCFYTYSPGWSSYFHTYPGEWLAYRTDTQTLVPGCPVTPDEIAAGTLPPWFQSENGHKITPREAGGPKWIWPCQKHLKPLWPLAAIITVGIVGGVGAVGIGGLGLRLLLV